MPVSGADDPDAGVAMKLNCSEGESRDEVLVLEAVIFLGSLQLRS